MSKMSFERIHQLMQELIIRPNNYRLEVNNLRSYFYDGSFKPRSASTPEMVFVMTDNWFSFYAIMPRARAVNKYEQERAIMSAYYRIFGNLANDYQVEFYDACFFIKARFEDDLDLIYGDDLGEENALCFNFLETLMNYAKRLNAVL